MQSVFPNTLISLTRKFLNIKLGTAPNIDSEVVFFIFLGLYIGIAGVLILFKTHKKSGPILFRFSFMYIFGLVVFPIYLGLKKYISSVYVSSPLYYFQFYLYFSAVAGFKSKLNDHHEKDFSSEFLYSALLGINSIFLLRNFRVGEAYLFCMVLRTVISGAVVLKLLKARLSKYLVPAQLSWLFADVLLVLRFYHFVHFPMESIRAVWSFSCLLTLLGLSYLKKISTDLIIEDDGVTQFRSIKYKVPIGLN
jgi:hypothetical protein